MRLVKYTVFRYSCFGLKTLTTPIWPRKELHTSKESSEAHEFSFEIGKISVIRAYEIKRVRPDLYGATCLSKLKWIQKSYPFLTERFVLFLDIIWAIDWSGESVYKFLVTIFPKFRGIEYHWKHHNKPTTTKCCFFWHGLKNK